MKKIIEKFIQDIRKYIVDEFNFESTVEITRIKRMNALLICVSFIHDNRQVEIRRAVDCAMIEYSNINVAKFTADQIKRDIEKFEFQNNKTREVAQS